MESCSILICSFGSQWWRDLATERALPSALAQGDHEIILSHDPDPTANLGQLRNRAALATRSEYLCFLDADDELEPGYIAAMMEGTSAVLRPKVRVLCEGPNETPMPEPFEVDPRPILEGNYVIVGAPIRRDLFLGVGGFSDDDYCEDWVLFIKAWIAGAKFDLVPKAVYRQNWRRGSRNQPDPAAGDILRQKIRDHYRPLAQKAGLL